MTLDQSVVELLQTVLANQDRFERQLAERQQEKGYFTVAEAAHFISCSTDHLRRHVKAGNIPVSNIGSDDGPDYRIARADLVAWMDKRKAGHFVSPRRKKAAAEPVKYQSRHHHCRQPASPTAA